MIEIKIGKLIRQSIKQIIQSSTECNKEEFNFDEDSKTSIMNSKDSEKDDAKSKDDHASLSMNSMSEDDSKFRGIDIDKVKIPDFLHRLYPKYTARDYVQAVFDPVFRKKKILI